MRRQTKNNLPLGCFLFFVCLTLIGVLWAIPAQGATDNITKRLSNLESRWGHLQLGGEFSLLADYKQRFFEEYRTPDLKNYLNLYLDAQIDRNFYFYLMLSYYDNYGYINHLYLSEAAVRYRSPQLLVDLGKFYFTLDPLGLIADHSTSPLQGFAVQTGNTDLYLGGFYSRLFLNPASIDEEKIGVTSDDQLGLRIAVPKPGYMLGMTLVTTPEGDLSETAIGLDFITNVADGALQTEVAWYKPGTDSFQSYKHDGAYGGLVTWSKNIAATTYTLNAWYFEKGFAPISSVLNDSFLEKGEIYANNSYGIGGGLQHKMANNWDATVKAGVLLSPDQTFSGPQLTFSGRLRKAFSIATNLEFGFDSGFEADVNKIDLHRYNRLFVGFNTIF
ncbi:hypothetical protein G5B42_04675 [Hydrogenispora sp. UU3]|uniref:Uncharacterized protein n=1 Tax=Capillibacterium thermochitinicola TaxID=2699427 RepID=A0A8J6I1U0_9FIRM|nr:hypothetical protein [Capillibacterium thermochitinicola]